MYNIVYTKKAVNDILYLKSAKLDKKAKTLIDLIKNNPYTNPPPYEKLLGQLHGAYSRRIRLVYEVIEDKNTIKIISLWSHYEF